VAFLKQSASLAVHQQRLLAIISIYCILAT